MLKTDSSALSDGFWFKEICSRVQMLQIKILLPRDIRWTYLFLSTILILSDMSGHVFSRYVKIIQILTRIWLRLTSEHSTENCYSWDNNGAFLIVMILMWRNFNFLSTFKTNTYNIFILCYLWIKVIIKTYLRGNDFHAHVIRK